MRLDDLHLWYLGEPAAPRYVGALQLVAAGKGVSLRYSAQWLASGFAMSEDLPLVEGEFLPAGRLAADTPRAVGAVDDARPDRWGEKVIRFIDRPKRLSLMEYLYFAGDDRFGALGVSTSATVYSPREGGPLPRLEQAQQLSEIVAKIEASEPINALEAKLIAGGGSPLGGTKPKALISIEGVQWVIKFFNNEPVDSPLIEHATMTLAQRAGITVAQTQAIRLAGVHAIAVRRFDREPGRRIHSISAGTALRAAAASGAEPEMGYPELARTLRRAGITQDDTNLHDARELFRRMVFNILIDNTDDHEKNHALLRQADGTYALSPAFDVLPAAQGLGVQAMDVGERGTESSIDNAMSQAAAFGLRPDAAMKIVSAIAGVVDQWKEHFQAAGVRDVDIQMLEQYIDGANLGRQRADVLATGRSVLTPASD
jgi:serine/threonine-protein kinase HipA